MARVIIPTTLRDFCAGTSKLDVPGSSIEQILRGLDEHCPGFYARVVEAGRLRPELAFALDGEVMPLGLYHAVGPDSEITIVPAIGGGGL